MDFTNIKAVANAISGLLAEVQSQTPAFAAPSNAHEGGGPQKDQMAESLLTKIYVLAAYNSVLRSVSEVGNQVSQQFAQPGLDLYSRADQAYRGDGERALDRSLQVLVEFATMANSQTSELIGQVCFQELGHGYCVLMSDTDVAETTKRCARAHELNVPLHDN